MDTDAHGFDLQKPPKPFLPFFYRFSGAVGFILSFSDERVLPQPAIQVLAHEVVVGEVRVGTAHAVDLRGLAGREI